MPPFLFDLLETSDYSFATLGCQRCYVSGEMRQIANIFHTKTSSVVWLFNKSLLKPYINAFL